MMTSKGDQQTEFTEKEQEQRDKLLRKLLKTPPKPRPKRERSLKAGSKLEPKRKPSG